MSRRRGGGSGGPPANQGNRQVVVAQFSGPLPPPAVLAQYDQIVPGAADRIITMAEGQSSHRRWIERFGQIGAFILAFTVLVGGLALVALGKDTAGLSVLAGEAVALIGAFMYGRFANQ